VRSVSEWAQVRALVADGVSQREIATRLGMNRRTVKRLAEAAQPPRYRREPVGSMLDPLEPVIGQVLAEVADIKAPRFTELLREDYGYSGSVDLVRKRLAELRPKTELQGGCAQLEQVCRSFLLLVAAQAAAVYRGLAPILGDPGTPGI
jgi:transposase